MSPTSRSLVFGVIHAWLFVLFSLHRMREGVPLTEPCSLLSSSPFAGFGTDKVEHYY
jgi:hypothetical protein